MIRGNIFIRLVFLWKVAILLWIILGGVIQGIRKLVMWFFNGEGIVL
jgi:hypothetical protein